MPIRLDYQAYDSLLFISFETCGPETVLPVPADSLIDGLNSRASIVLKTALPGRRPAQNLTTHRKRDCNRCVDFDRVAVQHRGLVAPLFHGIQCGLHQERVTGDHFELRYLAVLVDDRMQDDAALNARLPSQGRIERASLREDRCRRHV